MNVYWRIDNESAYMNVTGKWTSIDSCWHVDALTKITWTLTEFYCWYLVAY